MQSKVVDPDGPKCLARAISSPVVPSLPGSRGVLRGPAQKPCQERTKPCLSSQRMETRMLDPQRTLVAGAVAKLHLPQGDPSTPQWPGHLQVQLMVLHALYPIRGTDCPDVPHIRWPGVLPLFSLLSSLSLLSFLLTVPLSLPSFLPPSP